MPTEIEQTATFPGPVRRSKEMFCRACEVLGLEMATALRLDMNADGYVKVVAEFYPSKEQMLALTEAMDSVLSKPDP